MLKHTQTIRRLLLTNCLYVFDHFVGLALKWLKDVTQAMTCIFVCMHVNFTLNYHNWTPDYPKPLSDLCVDFTKLRYHIIEKFVYRFYLKIYLLNNWWL